MRSGMPQGIVVMREWEDLGCAAYQSHVQQKIMKFDLITSSNVDSFKIIKFLNILPSFAQ